VKRLLLAAVLAVAACTPTPAVLPDAPLPYRTGVAIQAQAVLLSPRDPTQTRIGDFVYAGGLALTSSETARLHGLSDLRILAGDQLVAISDEGDLLEAHLRRDKAGRLVGLDGARLTVLDDLDGKPLQGKAEADSEGLAVLADGDRLVSFERHDRVWRYPAAGGAALEAPFPAAEFPPNEGMEALAAYPASGPDAYLVGGEASGQTWICHVVGGCVEWEKIDKPAAFGLVSAAPMPAGGGVAYLLRAWDPLQGVRIKLLIRRDGAEIARMEMAAPYTIDNFEGLDAVANPDGSVRFYLISDDNFQAIQRTLLVAFDWKPAAPEAPRQGQRKSRP